MRPVSKCFAVVGLACALISPASAQLLTEKSLSAAVAMTIAQTALETCTRKAYTARTFRIPSGEFAQRVKDNPTLGAVHLTGIIAAQGALPIKVGDEVIGAVGVSGAPGGEKDETCAKSGIDRIADQLK